MPFGRCCKAPTSSDVIAGLEMALAQAAAMIEQQQHVNAPRNAGSAKQYALRECRAEERGQPYCRECGSENLAYLEQYANGSEYKCRVCGTVQMWD